MTLGQATPTIYDVAREAGVSISTVSNALNHPERVGAATRERILAAADALGFVPKADAVNLARRGVKRIGVFAPFSSYSSFMRRLSGVLVAARGQGIEAVVFDYGSAAQLANPVLAGIPVQGRFDGLLVMGIEIDDSVRDRLLDRQIPTVLLDAPSESFSTVTMNDAAGGRLSAAYLYDLGHRRFGYLIERQLSEYNSQAERRLAGFTAELKERGGCEITVVEAEGTVESAKAATESGYLRNPPTALMAHFDDMALGAIQALVSAGLRVPQDVSVMGYDDGPLAEAIGLSTIRQPFEESGEIATRLLQQLIQEPTASRTSTQLDVSVVERTTTNAVLPGASSSTIGAV